MRGTGVIKGCESVYIINLACFNSSTLFHPLGSGQPRIRCRPSLFRQTLDPGRGHSSPSHIYSLPPSCAGKNKKAFVAARALNPAGLISNRTPADTLLAPAARAHSSMPFSSLCLSLQRPFLIKADARVMIINRRAVCSIWRRVYQHIHVGLASGAPWCSRHRCMRPLRLT